MNRTFTMPVVVVARSDGRGGIRPFGTFRKEQSGAKVAIGEKQYTVTKDGRVNIPASIFKQYGEKGNDGKLRISIGFSSEKGIDGWKFVSAVIVRPSEHDRNAMTGDKIRKFREDREKDLIPKDIPDYSWSPS